MAMGLRHLMARYLPSWLGDQYPAGPSYGYRVLWAHALLVDGQLEVMLQASLAAVGKGTPTALKYLEAARGITRGRLDTDAQYAAKLPKWIDRLKAAGSQLGLAKELASYLGESRVRVINRAGNWITVNVDGTVTTTNAAWNWDSISHPEHAGYWSDLWIVVYRPTAWTHRGSTVGALAALGGDDGFGIGQMVPRQEHDAAVGVIDRFKAAHSRVRAVIFTADNALFNPAVPASCPDGTWGGWGGTGSAARYASGRNLTACRFWEP